MKLRDMALSIAHMDAEHMGLENYRSLHIHNQKRVEIFKQTHPDLGTKLGMLMVRAYMHVMEMARLLGRMSTMVFDASTTFDQVIRIKDEITAARNAAYDKYAEVGRIIREAQ